MDEDYNMVRGIDKLAELLIERGIEFCVNDEFSLVFKDDVGNLHECWLAGAGENRVNALIVVTPEQLLSVPDLNGIIAENDKLRAENAKLREQIHWLKQGDILHVLTDQEYIDQCERERLMQVSIDALDDENAKLRELVKALHECTAKTIPAKRCTECDLFDGEDGCLDLVRMRELGIEVSHDA